MSEENIRTYEPDVSKSRVRALYIGGYETLNEACEWVKSYGQKAYIRKMVLVIEGVEGGSEVTRPYDRNVMIGEYLVQESSTLFYPMSKEKFEEAYVELGSHPMPKIPPTVKNYDEDSEVFF